MQAQDILKFWFEELTDKQHFAKDTALDEMIRRRFGRFPHRNAVLRRTSSADELAFLSEAGSSF